MTHLEEHLGDGDAPVSSRDARKLLKESVCDMAAFAQSFVRANNTADERYADAHGKFEDALASYASLVGQEEAERLRAEVYDVP